MDNKKMKKELEKKYKQVYEISNGNFYVSTKTSYEVCDEDYASFDTGIIFGNPGCWGMLNKDGKVIIEPKYLFPLLKVGNNYQVVMLNQIKIIDGKRAITGILQGLINELGEEIIPIKYPYMKNIDSSYNNFIVYDSKLGKCGIIDKNNNEVVPFNYEYISDPSYESCLQDKNVLKYPKRITQLAVVKNGLYGVYDIKANREIVKPKYRYLKVVGPNRFAVGKDYNEMEKVITVRGRVYTTYDEVYKKNLKKIELKLEEMKLGTHYDDSKGFNIKVADPDRYAVRFDNLDNIICMSDGLISFDKIKKYNKNVDDIYKDYKMLRKYPIVYFPATSSYSINTERKRTLGDRIDYTFYDIKQFYNLINEYKSKFTNKNLSRENVKKYYEKMKTKTKFLALENSYFEDTSRKGKKIINFTFDFLTSFSSFKDFMEWEFKNDKDLIELFVDIKNDYKVYNIETKKEIDPDKKSYKWSRDYYNNLKEIIANINEKKDRLNEKI